MKEDFTTYDIKPEGFLNYLRYYGEHFNKKLCEFACNVFNCHFYNKEKLDILSQSHNESLDLAILYDAVFIANHTKAFYYGNGIPDEKSLIQYVKTAIDKENDVMFARFIADMAKKGIPIDWEEMI